MIFSHLRWIRIPLPNFLIEFGRITRTIFFNIGGQPPPPLAPPCRRHCLGRESLEKLITNQIYAAFLKSFPESMVHIEGFNHRSHDYARISMSTASGNPSGDSIFITLVLFMLFISNGKQYLIFLKSLESLSLTFNLIGSLRTISKALQKD